MTNPGEQLDGQLLYERQLARRAADPAPGPAIIAAGLRNAENIGAVLRLADAAGCREAVFVGGDLPDQRRVRQAARSCDALVSWRLAGDAQFAAEAAAYRPLIAIEITDRSVDLFACQLPPQCALVIGGERHGIPADLLAMCAMAAHIPMYGVNGSMNVTHALAIALFEWRRQMGVR
jgi:tRNA G18 (ribose-2'-O)-methylase SpoU